MTDPASRTCSVPSCARGGRLKVGMCGMHYQRMKSGKPLTDPPKRVYAPGETCTVEGCDDGARFKGMCGFHWQRAHHGREVEAPRKVRNQGQACAIEGCEKSSRKRGWCPMHYERWKAHGDPTVVKALVRGACSVEGCSNPHNARGYCVSHGRRARLGKPVEVQLRVHKRGECEVEGCERHGRFGGYCGTHRDRIAYALNPEPFKARTARRRQRVAELTAEERELSDAYRLAIANDPCTYCGDPAGEHTDHVFPLAKDGTDHWWNLARACSSCNREKWARCGTWFRLRKGDGARPRTVPPLPEADPIDR
jgi:5-methylcytosine-specific restriction endonuclease McrA